MARMEPGKLEPKAIMPGPPWAVYVFWKMESPENMRPKALPMPPAPVSIFMLGLIQTMEPRSVIMDSPPSRWQTTTGRGSPRISYFMLVPPFFKIPPVYYDFRRIASPV